MKSRGDTKRSVMGVKELVLGNVDTQLTLQSLAIRDYS